MGQRRFEPGRTNARSALDKWPKSITQEPINVILHWSPPPKWFAGHDISEACKPVSLAFKCLLEQDKLTFTISKTLQCHRGHILWMVQIRTRPGNPVYGSRNVLFFTASILMKICFKCYAQTQASPTCHDVLWKEKPMKLHLDHRANDHKLIVYFQRVLYIYNALIFCAQIERTRIYHLWANLSSPQT